MTPEEFSKLQYPVGKFSAPSKYDMESRRAAISILAAFPAEVEKAYSKLKSLDRFNIQYRPEGWNAREVIHHVADSHMNAYIRFKLTLTEDNPTIKPYIESLWAKLSDSRDMDPIVSVDLTRAVHSRWVHVLNNMEPDEFSRTYFHPESGKQFTLDLALSIYAWHCRHHLAHLHNVINN
ncbi:MAG: putative metal-dependent hydrolase [Bacteroidetes bacterium]|nr:putative metal-dependent hydrolase [Bacteroidota bacterium]